MNRNKCIKVSIILPSLNVKEFYRECIESAVNQTFEDIEILCVDAGSTDGTVEIIKEYEEKDKRVVFVHSDVKSYGYQVNLGISMARGKYVAILETDDYVSKFMYEKLYTVAEKNSADYVKADFNNFVTYKNGAKKYSNNKLWRSKTEIYGKVINPSEYDEVFLYDYNVWKGIYSKEFLLNNRIQFNETKGAAFQDIGFSELVFEKASRAVYIDDEFYFYRNDRIGSSMLTGRGLKYCFDEFSVLQERRDTFEGNAKGMYLHMLSALVGNVRAINNVDALGDEEIWFSFIWMLQRICSAISDGIINSSDFEENIWDDFCEIRDDVDKFVFTRQAGLSNSIQCIEKVKALEGATKYIWGAGEYGQRCHKLLDDANIDIVAFVDSSIEKIGKQIDGIEVKKPDIIKVSDCVVIASKYHWKEIKKQLIDKGISEDRIIIYGNIS